MKRKTIFIFLILIILAVILMPFFFRSLTTATYEICSADIPESFDGYRIVQITDLHGASFGQKESELLKAIKDCEPDLIVFTGDMYDEYHGIGNLLEVINGSVKLAPVYAVSGNHEFDSWMAFQVLLSLYDAYGVTFLDDNSTLIENDAGESIYLAGAKFHWLKDISELPPADPNHYSILLNHAGNYFDVLCQSDYDLVLSGHTHGGIIRLPVLGGLIGMGEDKILPRYDYGKYTANDTTMIISSGLGEAFPPRYNNPPEIVLITLRHSNE